MSCEDCARAALETWGCFTASCRGCVARMLSRSPAFAASMAAGAPTDAYRDGAKKAGLKHSEVVAAARADFMGSAE